MPLYVNAPCFVRLHWLSQWRLVSEWMRPCRCVAPSRPEALRYCWSLPASNWRCLLLTNENVNLATVILLWQGKRFLGAMIHSQSAQALNVGGGGNGFAAYFDQVSYFSLLSFLLHYCVSVSIHLSLSLSLSLSLGVIYIFFGPRFQTKYDLWVLQRDEIVNSIRFNQFDPEFDLTNHAYHLSLRISLLSSRILDGSIHPSLGPCRCVLIVHDKVVSCVVHIVYGKQWNFAWAYPLIQKSRQ